MKSNFLVLVSIVVSITAFLLPGKAMAQTTGIKRVELQREDLGIPGREAVQVSIEFEKGAAFGKHTHPGEEVIYVLEGEFRYEVEGRMPLTLKAGEVLFIPAGTVHAAANTGAGKAVELATYIVEKEKPLVNTNFIEAKKN